MPSRGLPAPDGLRNLPAANARGPGARLGGSGRGRRGTTGHHKRPKSVKTNGKVKWDLSGPCQSPEGFFSELAKPSGIVAM